MSLNQFEENYINLEIGEFIEKRRPPVHLRQQVDLSYEIDTQSIIIFELRERWDDPTQKTKSYIAKATVVKTTKTWKIYWFRSDGKWYSYEPNPEVTKLKSFIKELEEDNSHCFWG